MISNVGSVVELLRLRDEPVPDNILAIAEAMSIENDVEYQSFIDRILLTLHLELLKSDNEDYKKGIKYALQVFGGKIWVEDMTGLMYEYYKLNKHGHYRIVENCKNCNAEPEEIIYQNSGPITRVYCPKCGFSITKDEIDNNCYPNWSIIDKWNYECSQKHE